MEFRFFNVICTFYGTSINNDEYQDAMSERALLCSCLVTLFEQRQLLFQHNSVQHESTILTIPEDDHTICRCLHEQIYQTNAVTHLPKDHGRFVSSVL